MTASVNDRIAHKCPLMPTILIVTELRLRSLNNKDAQAEELLYMNQIVSKRWLGLAGAYGLTGSVGETIVV